MNRFNNFFLGLFVALLPSTGMSEPATPPVQVIDGTEEVFFSDQQRRSINSAVKVEGLAGGHGSGTYVEVDGHYLVITARHVIDLNEIHYVSTPNEKVVGQVVWKSRTKDIAALKVPKITSRTAISLHRTGNLDVGDELVYTGYPAGYELLTTRATVSGHSPVGRATLLQGFVWFGYSGSGAFDETGRLRAIVIAIASESWRGMPQLLETVVYSHEISKKEIAQIKESLAN